MAERQKMLFLLTHGLNAPQLARSCMMFAAISAVMEVDTTVYCVMEGAEVMVKGNAEKDVVKPGKPDLTQRLKEAIDAGVKIQVCNRTLKAKGIPPDQLIDGAKIVGATTLVDIALDADATLTF